jgi:hypothetical protein
VYREVEEEMSDEDVVQIIVVPEDGLCEGCGEPFGDEVFETDDMMILCRRCWDDCLEES